MHAVEPGSKTQNAKHAGNQPTATVNPCIPGFQTMEICEKGAALVEREGDLVFSHTKLILKDGQQYYYAITPRRCRSIPKIDISDLDLQPIPSSQIWPKFTEEFTRAPEPLPPNAFVKQPSLLDYGDTIASTNLSSLLQHEDRMCEVLRNHPHPNIVEYYGCVAKEDKLVGLCFVRYKCTLADIVKNQQQFDKDVCLKGIEDGIRHIHSLGFVNCDIKPDNILMDGSNPRIGDFDSCHTEGSKLGVKAGTVGWFKDEFTLATRDVDWYGFLKIREFLLCTKMTMQIIVDVPDLIQSA
jgi:serine/threonine protein kinase